MKKLLVAGSLLMIIGLGLSVASAQTAIDESGLFPKIIDTSGDYVFQFTSDTLFVNHERATTAEDSAKVDSCRLTKNLSIFQLNADNVTLDGNNQVIYGAGGADPLTGSYHDIQGIWPNRIYKVTMAFDNIRVSDVTVMLCNNAVYFTKVSNSLAENVTIKYANRGIYLQSRSSGNVISDGVGGELAVADPVRNCTLIDVYKEAIAVRGPGHQILNNTITNTRATYSKSAGISIQRSTEYKTTGILVKGNTIDGGSYLNSGIKADRAGFNTYADNTINKTLLNGVLFDGHTSGGLADENVFTNTVINLAWADSANGIYFYDLADNNVFDGVTIDSAGVAIKAIGNCRGNTITNGTITDSKGYDVVVEGGSSVLVTTLADIDTSKVLVEQGSAIYFGTDQLVDLKVLLDNSLPLPGIDVIVTNAGGDTVGSFVTDEDGIVNVDVAAEGITFSGYSDTQNPFTFSAVHELDDGTSALIGGVTTTVAKDTAITLSISYLGLADREADLPTEFALSQNYPNPFNPSTTIRYALPGDANVRLRVYDIAGRLVKTLIQGTQNAGYYYVMWDGTDNTGKAIASGIYIYELVAGDFRQVNKMMFLK